MSALGGGGKMAMASSAIAGMMGFLDGLVVKGSGQLLVVVS
jgi:hypothetical protein